MHVEPQEVYQLTSSIDLRLVSVLALSKHSSTIHVIPVLGGNEVGSANKNISPVLPTHLRPRFFGSQRCFDRFRNMRSVSGMKIRKRMRYLVRRMNSLQL